MKKYIELLGKVIENQTLESPERARKIIELAYSWVRFSTTHVRHKSVEDASEYMRGITAGLITDAFKHPKQSVMVNIFMPCEILHAMDLIPMYPEAISEYVACTACQEIFGQIAEENDIPETFCSYHKTMIGLAEAGVMPAPLMVANTTLACDANQLSFRRLAEDYGIPHTVIDIPHADDEDAIDYVADQLKALVPQLEEVAGKKLDEMRLLSHLECAQRTVNKFRKFVDRRGEISLPTTMTSEMCSLMTNHILLGREESEIYVDRLLKASEFAAPRDNKKKRIFWVHTIPLWQDSMAEIFNASPRCEIVGTDVAVDNLVDIDLTRPYHSMAARVVKSSYNGGAMNRIENILENAKKAKADGIIIFCHWGCKQTLGLSQMAKQHFEENGFPTLVLDGDGCDSRNVADGQMVTRVNAFIEQLEGTL